LGKYWTVLRLDIPQMLGDLYDDLVETRCHRRCENFTVQHSPMLVAHRSLMTPFQPFAEHRVPSGQGDARICAPVDAGHWLQSDEPALVAKEILS